MRRRMRRLLLFSGRPPIPAPTGLVNPQLATERNWVNSYLATDSGGTFRLATVARNDYDVLYFKYAGWTNGTTAGVGDVDCQFDILEAFCEIGGVSTPILFPGGATAVTVPAGGVVIGTCVVNVTNGTSVFPRIDVAPGPSGSYPVLGIASKAPGEGSAKGLHIASGTGTTGFTAAADVVGPVMITGHRTSGTTSAVAVVGDSGAAGIGDDFLNYTHSGFIPRALTGNRAWLLWALSSESISPHWLTKTTRRAPYIGPEVGYVLFEYGANDIATAATLASMQARMIQSWTGIFARNPNVRIVQTTLTPKSTSTDLWVTTINQTADPTYQVARPLLNDWLRDGAPMIGGVAVATGTAGALRMSSVSGTGAHPLWNWIEVADLVESARDSGIWKAGYTNDGLHPSPVGHAAAGAALDITRLGT